MLLPLEILSERMFLLAPRRMITKFLEHGIQTAPTVNSSKNLTFCLITRFYYDWMLWTSIEVCKTIFLENTIHLPHLGSKVAGHRGYFLTNDGVDLNHALIQYGLDFLRSKSYRKIQAPFMMNKEMMAKTAQLDQFDEELYKVNHPSSTSKTSNQLSR